MARPRVAILLVNGFARRGRWGRHNLEQALRYPWVDLCLRQVERHSSGWDYQVLVYDNTHLASHRRLMAGYERVRVRPAAWVAAFGRLASRAPVPHFSWLLERSHPGALDYLARKAWRDFDYTVTLDTDSLPVREDWLEVLIAGCERGAAVTGVYRDEMAPRVQPFVHVSGLCVRSRDLRSLGVPFGRDLSIESEHNQDVGQMITHEFLQRGRTIEPLRRSNRANFHFLMGGIYGDVIYHQGSGSRKGKFWTQSDRDNDDLVNRTLRDAAFRDIDHLVAVLRGQHDNDLGLEAI